VAKARAAGKGRALRRKPLGLRRRPLPSIADEELSMRQNRALPTVAPPADPQIIRHYHAHVYYDPVSSRDRAARLRERVAATFPDATLGRWHDALVGPHPQSMYQFGDCFSVWSHSVSDGSGLSAFLRD